MDESRPGSRSNDDDFATYFDTVYGTDPDGDLDAIRATDNNGHYEQVWNPETGKQVKIPPRVEAIMGRLIDSPYNKYRSMNDFFRGAMYREFVHQREREKDVNPVLAAELEIEARELRLQAEVGYHRRREIDEKNKIGAVLEICQERYSFEGERLVERLIAALKYDDNIFRGKQALENFRRGRAGS
jgi:hypothetical protein